jgi:hypothetical protein
VYFDLFEQPAPQSESVSVTLRKLSVHAQAIEVRVDATMIQFDVWAEMVSSNTNALRRLHLFYEVEFTDGMTSSGDIQWPDEVVFFTEDGLEIVVPFHWGDDEFVTFTEDAFGIAFAIQQAEFVALADFGIRYVLDFRWDEAARYSDISIAAQGVINRNESVFITESLVGLGGNSVALAEYVSVSEVMLGGPAVIFADAVFMAEFWTRVLDFFIQPDSVTWLDELVVSEVAATDSRPGAFIPGAALLGSPQ